METTQRNQGRKAGCSCCGCWVEAPGRCSACWTHQRDGLPCDQWPDDVIKDMDAMEAAARGLIDENELNWLISSSPMCKDASCSNLHCPEHGGDNGDEPTWP